MERIKMNALTLCILIFVLVCNFLYSVGIKWTKYNYESYFHGYKCVPNETIFEKFNVYDSVTCFKICHLTNKCVSYLYQPDNHLCIGCRVYGAIWTGHYDELPGSVYVARQCDQEYKRVGHFTSLWMIDKYTFNNLDAELCTHIILKMHDFTGYPWRKQFPHDEERIKKLQQLKDSNPCLKTFIHAHAAPVYEEIGAVLSFLRTYGFNGIDIQDMTEPEFFSAENLVGKVEEIKHTFDLYGYRLTAAVPAREIGIDVKPLVEHLDFIHVKLLGPDDFADDKTLIFFPLYQSSQVSNGQQLNMNSNAEYWISKGVPKNKLILGIAAFGYQFELINEEENQIGAPAVGWVPQEKLYYEICQMQEKGLGTERWDDEQNGPYYINGKVWISYDNVRSISEKMYWLKEKGYGGACIYKAYGDDSKEVCKSSSRPHPLLSVIYDILTSGEVMTTAKPRLFTEH